ASVSSTRRMNVPSWPCASSQLKSAVRALPTCSCPVGLGANRTLTPDPRAGTRGLRRSSLPQQGDGMRGDRLAPADGIDAFVGLALHTHAIDGHANRRGHRGTDVIEMRSNARTLEDDDHVEVQHEVAGVVHEPDGVAEKLQARGILPGGIRVREMPA